MRSAITKVVDPTMKLSRRGIPGVSSDAYHFGFFEDTTSQRLAPPTHREYDAIIEPLQCFGIVLSSFVLVTILLFFLREFMWSLKEKERARSSGSVWSDHSFVVNEDRDAALFQQRNRAYPELQNPVESKSPYANASDPGHLEEIDEEHISQDDFNRLNVVNTSQSTLSGLGQFGAKCVPENSSISKKQPTSGKIGFTMRDLYSLRPSNYYGVSVSMYSSRIPTTFIRGAVLSLVKLLPVDFKSGIVAVKSLRDIGVTLRAKNVDVATKHIAVFRLVAMGADCISMINSNVFLPDFNRVMDILIDTGLIFDLLNRTNPYMSRVMIDLVIQFCYAHWIFGMDRDPRVIEKFRSWNFNGPLAQPHSVLLRYLVNLQLGLHTVERHGDPEFLTQTMSRADTLIKYIADNSSHGDPESMVPILAQAVEFAETTEMKFIYYRTLLKLSDAHGDCCMDKMLRRKDRDLKALIQGGLWVKNDNEIIKTTKKVYKRLLKVAPAIHKWAEEVNGGSVFVVPSPAPTHQSRAGSYVKVGDEDKPVRPGSWTNPSPKRNA